MTNWKIIKLGEILQLSNEKSIIQNQYPVLTSSRSGLYLQSDYFKKIVASKNNLGYKIINNGQFTYRAMSDDGYFKFNKLANQKAGIISPAYEVFDVSEGAANANFIEYLLNSIIISSQIYNAAQGGTRLALRFSTLANFRIKLPPLNEQNKIAKILTNIDCEILLIKDQKEKYNQLLNAIIIEIFQKLKQSFPTQKLLDACSLITKGATPTTYGYSLSNKRFPGSITFLGGGSTSKSGEFDLTPARYCTDKAVSVLKRSQLSKGDTLVTIVGASIGNTCQMPSYVLPANINQNVALVRADQSLLSRNFANLFLRTLGRQALIDISTTQAQPSVSLKQVGELQIPIPDFEYQLKINQAVKSINIFIDNLEKKIKKKELLKKAISCDLLSGRKRVSV